MFYCPTCREKNNWPHTLVQSEGKCEVCGNIAVCSDYPSYKLPAEDPRTKVTTDPFRGKWVLKYPDGTFVGVDAEAGGYPYRAHYPHNIMFWIKQELAEDYRGHFPEENFTLHEAMTLTVSLPVKKDE